MDIIEKIINEIKEKTKKEYIKLIAEPCDSMTQFDSKLGGIPYIPDNFEYPYSRTNPQQPLKLLAQINFADMPEIEEFKHLKGILQIYINPDDMYGWDYDNYTNQDNFRVIYHKDIDFNADNSDKIPQISYDDVCFPVEKEVKLSGIKEYDWMDAETESHNKICCEIYNKYSDEKINSLYDLDDDISEKIYEESNWGHKIGGYANYTQGEDFDDNYSVQLLQFDSEMIDGEYYIIWGDCGVAHWFINSEKLKNLDFSDIRYLWDCC